MSDTPPTSQIEEPIVVWFETSRPLVKEIMAKVYQEAALADADMATATRLLEQTRTGLLTERDAFKLWSLLDEKIGEADEQTLQPALIALRNWFKDQLFNQQQIRLGALLERNPERGWREWLRTYAEGLARWRHLLCRNLVDAPLSLPEQFQTPYNFNHATRLILHERWPEVYQFYTYLAEQEFLHPYTRARLLVPAGQIHLYYFNSAERALTLFQQAEKLAPGLARVLVALSEYYQEQNNFAKSRTYLEQAMQTAPDEVDSYTFLGSLAEKQGNLEEARNWYQEAINKVMGDSAGYSRLLRLYGQPAFFEQYESHIAPLAKRAVAVDETGEYRIYLDVGDAYSASKRYDTAQQWCDKAINLDPNRLDAYTWKGFAYLDEGENHYDAARSAFNAAIQAAPEAYNGYWGMGQLAERLGQWEEAANWYEKAKQCQPEYYSSFGSRMGEMQWKMGDLQKAEVTLLDALRHDLTNDVTIRNLANDYYKNQRKPEKALNLFEQIRDIKGEAFEAEYQNEIGNLYYYEGEYEKAAQHYLNASHLNQKQAVYYSNISLAYSELGRWTEAREYVKKAYEQDADRRKYESQLLRLFNTERRALEKSLPTFSDGLERLDKIIADIHTELEQVQDKTIFSDQLTQLEEIRRFVTCYGTYALKFYPIGKPVRIYLSADLLPFILDENQKLSKSFLARIDVMRERLHKNSGLRVPGLTFSESIESDPAPHSYQVQIMDRRMDDGQIDAYDETDIQERLLYCVENIISDHLDELCGQQETANLLDVCNTIDCTQIKNNPLKLRALTRQLKNVLRQDKSIVDLASIAAEVNERASIDDSMVDQLWPKMLAQELSPGITRLILYISQSEGSNQAELVQKLENLQQTFFDELGIILPQVTIMDCPGGFQLQINEEKLPIQPFGMLDQYMTTELRNRADQILTIDIVKYYLRKLETDLPALIKVVQYCFSAEKLTQLLRDRLRNQLSIKNLPRVLEELLSADSDIL